VRYVTLHNNVAVTLHNNVAVTDFGGNGGGIILLSELH
jgi:hypothetical protein